MDSNKIVNAQLTDRIRKGEGTQLDFKMWIDDQKKIARTLVAFANTEGGSLLIGVKDNGKISGIEPSEEFHMISAAAELYCNPEVDFKTIVWQEKHKLVLEVIVPESNQLHTAHDENGKPRLYLRVNDSTLLANKIMAKYMMLVRRGTTRPELLTEEAIALLKTIGPDGKYTLSKVYRLSGLPKKVVDHYLPLFLAWGLIGFEVQDSTFLYFSEDETQ